MGVNLSFIGGAGWQFLDSNGNVLSGGKIYTYAAGTTTPLATFTSRGGDTPNTNPIILDSAGRTPYQIWSTEGVLYKYEMTTSDDVLIRYWDDIGGSVVASDLAQDIANNDDFAKGDALVGFRQSNNAGNISGAVGTTIHQKMQESLSVKDFGAVGDGVTDDYDAFVRAWEYCHPIGASLHLPSGTYYIADKNFPFRNTQTPVMSLLDCNNMTIYGDGPSTILKTSSVYGADVLQLNGLKNFHVRNMQVRSAVSGSSAGSNGVSVTGGFDNITIDNFWATNLGYVDKTTYVDGGKAITIQPPSETNPITMGTFKATNIYADSCVYGFGYEPDNDLALTQPVGIDVEITVSNCRQGVVMSAPAATGSLSANSTSGVRIRGQSINCMQDIVCSRTFGVDIDMQIIQTKTAAQLLLSYDGTQWSSADTVSDVIGVICTYAKNSRVAVNGSKSDCYHKVKIGGAFDPSSGLVGATDNCDFYFGITGTSMGVDVQFNDAGGNIMNNSRLYVTTSTAITLPIEFYDPALDNTITIGPDNRVQNVAVTGEIGWTEADGRTIRHNKYLLSGNLSTRQTNGGSADLIVEQWTNHDQARVFAVRNDGSIVTGGKGTATNVATIKGILPIYDENNVFWGYVPVYTTYTP